MRYPGVRWSIFSSRLHNQQFTVISAFKLLFLKQFVRIAASVVLSFSFLMFPNLAKNMTLHYPPVFRPSYMGIVHAFSSLSIFLLSSLACCPSFVLLLSVILSLRHLAVCNMAELMLCRCLRTVCISGSLLLSTYSTSFVVSTTWACF